MSLDDEERRLLARAAAWPDEGELTAARLAEIARSEGLDFATALWYERLLRVPANAEFLRLAETYANPQGAGAPPPRVPPSGQGRPDSLLECELIGVVPGAFHREHCGTGADGARVLGMARALGCAAEVIPTASFGTLEANAHTILDWLATHRGRRVALISLSKGGADVKYALSLLEAATAFTEVTMWVSFSGLGQGTPLIAWLQRRPLRWWGVRLLLWWRGHTGAALRQLRHEPGAVWPELPPHLRVVHVCGFPLRRHLAHRWAPRAYARLAPLGPNDGGGILLADCARWPGVVCPIWGADHYLMPAWDALPLLTGVVAAALTPRQATASASQPSAPPAARSSA